MEKLNLGSWTQVGKVYFEKLKPSWKSWKPTFEVENNFDNLDMNFRKLISTSRVNIPKLVLVLADIGKLTFKVGSQLEKLTFQVAFKVGKVGLPLSGVGPNFES